MRATSVIEGCVRAATARTMAATRAVTACGPTGRYGSLIG